MSRTGCRSLTDISELAGKLHERNAKTVALQFPEGLKRRSLAFASALRDEGFSILISGDPCWGACDPALRLLEYADVLVHFGHSEMISHPDIIYEPLYMDFDPAVLENALPLLNGKKIGVVTTVQHVHMDEKIKEFLESRGIEALFGEGGDRVRYPGQVLGCSFSAARIPGVSEILYVGTGVFHPLGVQLATGARVIALDPYTGEAGEVSADRFLRRRHALIEKARNAENFGIIVSLKAGQNRYGLARRLGSLSDKGFLVIMDEVTPDELLNLGFPCYVNTACPRLAYDDQARYPVPVITPAEYEIVCGIRSWDEYRIDEIE